MESVEQSPYWLTRFVFQRLLGFIYLVGFLVAFFQFCPLAGQDGILPIKSILDNANFWESPSLFWLHPTDHFFKAIALAGIVLSTIALTGLSDSCGMFVSVTVWSLLWAFYLSFVNFGQLFYGYGWEDMLLETGFLAIFFGASNTTVPIVVIWFLRWELFRVMFGAGLIKINGDSCWRDLTCMEYHYQTQPLPNPLSWYLDKLPGLYHKFEVLFNHFIELIAPWGFFIKAPYRYWAGGLTIFFQILLILSGNLSFLNYLTITIAIACFDDNLLSRFISIKPPQIKEMTRPRKVVIYALSVLIVLLSIQPAMNLISSNQVMNSSYDPLHLVNSYGAFGSVSRERYEVVIEGTNDANVTPDTQWKEYEFKCKPSDLASRPCVVSPYHYRLDWQMWFIPFSVEVTDHGLLFGGYEFWFLRFIEKLLQGDGQTLDLLKNNPFPKGSPHFIRARYYLYKYTSWQERQRTGDWWKRTLVGEYLPPVDLQALKNYEK